MAKSLSDLYLVLLNDDDAKPPCDGDDDVGDSVDLV